MRTTIMLRERPKIPVRVHLGSFLPRAADSWRGGVGLLLLGVLLPLLSASSCTHPTSEDAIVPAGLKIQNALPAFPTADKPNDYVLYDVNYPTSLRLDLNQMASPDELTLGFWPPVEDGWTRRVSTTSAIFWIDGFAPQPDTELQRILIDGPRFAHPWLWEFLTKAQSAVSGSILAIAGQRTVGGPSPEYTLLLFYDYETAGYVNSPAQLFALPAHTVDLAITKNRDAERESYLEVVDGLTAGKYYAMGIILDTSGDGIYDPQVDWWGIATDGATSLVPTFVPALTDPIAMKVLDADLRAPPVR